MEARIYKPKRLQNGKRITGRLYRARIKLAGDGKVRDIALQVSDKQVAQQKLNKLIQELEHESAGLIPAKVEREAAQSPLLDLVSEYVNELTVLGRSGDHLRHVDKRLRRLVRECGWTRLADVTPASFQTWRKEQSHKAPKTLNEYLATLSAFWTWLRKQSRVSVNPFELVERTDTRGKERIQRRALSDAQVVQLLNVAGKNQLAYMLPLYAGLRRNEVKTLRWSNLVLGESGGLLRIHAAVNKNRKEQALPLHRELAEVLQQQKPADSKADDLVLVNGVPKMKEFRQDLKKAGIPFLDERGHRMDYHALRTTFITRLSTMKVHPRLAMELARHSDMRLTMKTYTDAGQLPLREVMDTLPGFGGRSDSRIDSRTLGATGQSVSQPVIEKRELKTKKSLANTGESHGDSSPVTMSPEKSEWRREGDTFSVLSYGSATGTFANTVLPRGFIWNTNYGASSYTISVVTNLPPGSVKDLVSDWRSGQALLQFTGSADASYTVLATTNLTVPTTNWVSLGQATLQTGVSFQYEDDQSSAYPQRFYQIRSP
jgi:integrase